MEANKSDFSMIRNQAEEFYTKAIRHVAYYHSIDGNLTKTNVTIERAKVSEETQEYRSFNDLVEHIVYLTNRSNSIINTEAICNDIGLQCYIWTEVFPEYKNGIQKIFVAAWKLYFA